MCKRMTQSNVVLGIGLFLLIPVSLSVAQPADMMLDPGGTIAAPSPVTSTAPTGQANASAGAGEGGRSGVDFIGDYLEGNEFDNDRIPFHGGVTPYTHTIVTGDTLWDLSAYYFNDAWKWPKVWGLNPEVTNPHWIYPGNILRLREGQALPAAAPSTDKPQVRRAPAPSGRNVGLRQVAYVDLRELEDAGKITGSVDDKGLLSAGDSIYIDYPKNDVPKVGQRFAVYRTRTKIRRKGKSVGAYVEVTGELEVVKTAKDKRARAVVVRSVRPLERGMHVGPLQLNFSDVQAVTNKKKVDGNIIELIGPDELIGAQAAILINRGREDGVEVGNRFLVVRRGDAYRIAMEAGNNVGLNDDRYPARAIGEVIVVQTGEAASMGIVTFSIREFGVGDRVYMRKGK